MDRLTELTKKLSTGKTLSATEWSELSVLGANKAREEENKGLEEKMEKIKKVLEETGLTIERVYNHLRNPPKKIFSWKGNDYFKGTKGKLPAWTKTLKEEVKTLKEAEQFALDDDGKEWVNKVYNPAT